MELVGGGYDDFAIIGFPLKEIVAGELDLYFGFLYKGLEFTSVNRYVLVVEVHMSEIDSDESL